MSISGGFDQAIKDGHQIGCTAIQIFTKSNRQWAAKPIATQEIEAFENQKKASQMQLVVAHATYLINLASENKEVRDKSMEALAIELQRCALLSIPYLVLHPGSGGKQAEAQSIAHIINGLNVAFNASKTESVTILLETMAGQGSSIGSQFEQIATISQKSEYKNNIGTCVDTCHIFAAGYDFRTPETYKATWDLFNATIGLSTLKVIHCNDSKKELGSHVDRHEDIGKGKIGLEGFAHIMNDKRFDHVAKIAETPKDEAHPLKDDERNVETLKSLIK